MHTETLYLRGSTELEVNSTQKLYSKLTDVGDKEVAELNSLSSNAPTIDMRISREYFEPGLY